MSAVDVLREVDDLLGQLPNRGPLTTAQNEGPVNHAHTLVCDALRRRRDEWHEDPANRAGLYEWLFDRAEAPTGQRLVEYLATPWRWDQEWSQMQRELDNPAEPEPLAYGRLRRIG